MLRPFRWSTVVIVINDPNVKLEKVKFRFNNYLKL